MTLYQVNFVNCNCKIFTDYNISQFSMHHEKSFATPSLTNEFVNYQAVGGLVWYVTEARP